MGLCYGSPSKWIWRLRKGVLRGTAMPRTRALTELVLYFAWWMRSIPGRGRWGWWRSRCGWVWAPPRGMSEASMVCTDGRVRGRKSSREWFRCGVDGQTALKSGGERRDKTWASCSESLPLDCKRCPLFPPCSSSPGGYGSCGNVKISSTFSPKSHQESSRTNLTLA